MRDFLLLAGTLLIAASLVAAVAAIEDLYREVQRGRKARE